MVVFTTSEGGERWLAAVRSCRVLMMTDDIQLHDNDVPTFRTLAELMRARRRIERINPEIWR